MSGLKSAKVQYGENVDLAEFELNPLWKKDIAKLRLVNVRHLVLVAFPSMMMAVWSGVPDNLVRTSFRFMLGFLTIGFAWIVGSHIAQISMLVFSWKHPAILAGAPRGRWWAVKQMQFGVLMLVVPLCVVLVLYPTPFLLGGLAGLVLLMALLRSFAKEAR